MDAADWARGDAPSESECVDCPARATVGIMIKGVARQLGQIGAGDGRAPAALWAAMCAEDWQGIQREWDRWMRPQLTRLADSRRDWKWAADSVIEHTRDVLDEALPPDAAVLKVMRCTAAWLTGKDELPPPVAARWEEREWGRAWHEWDAWLWGELNRVQPERLWPEVTKPVRYAPTNWLDWRRVIDRVLALALDGPNNSMRVARELVATRAALSAAVNLNEPNEIRGAWVWIRWAVKDLIDRLEAAGWADYVDTLPPDLQAMAAVMPGEQAASAAITFELAAEHGYELYFPPDPPKEQ